MKIFNIFLTFIVFCLVSQQTNNLKTLGMKFLFLQANTTDAATGGSAAGGSVKNTNVHQGKDNSTNAVGTIGPANFSVTVAPYVVKSCDQVLLVKCQILTDMDNYEKRKTAFFTMNLFMINVFETAANNRLSHSIYLDNMKRVPHYLTGSRTCINFNDSKFSKNVALCFDNKERMNEIIKAFHDFNRCRSGDDLKPVTLEAIKRLVKIYDNCTDTKASKHGRKFNQYVVHKNMNFEPYQPEYFTPVPGTVYHEKKHNKTKKHHHKSH